MRGIQRDATEDTIATARLAGLEHGDDMRIIDRRSRSRLAQEPAPDQLVRRQGRREDLQRHLPVKPLISRAEHLPQPSRPRRSAADALR
jgi:hypothetical protein